MKRAIAQGATWMVLFKLAEHPLGFVSILILARLLVPADFGLIAMAMSAIAIIELASALTFEVALIQREHTTREPYDTAWTLSVALGTASALGTVGLAYPAGLFYGEPRLTPVMLVLAGGWIVQSFLFRTSRMSSRVYTANLWRPVAAATVMGFVVYALVPELAVRVGPGAFGALRQLIIGILAGVGAYVIVLWAVWLASGRPRGAETYLLDHADGLALLARDGWQGVARRV